MPIGDIPNPDANSEIAIHARALRQIVDPYDQIRDIGNCLDYLQSVSEVDENRIGLWGSSYGGGHVSFTAAHDPRVKVIVAQVGALNSRARRCSRPAAPGQWRGRTARSVRSHPLKTASRALSARRTLRKWSTTARWRRQAKIRVPKLVIDAEQEEPFDRMQNGHALYEVVSQSAPARYVTFPCKHSAIYDQYYREASNLARDWFIAHLKKPSS